MFSGLLNSDGFAKNHISQLNVIPAQAGIQEFQRITNRLDTRFHGYDGFLRVHQPWNGETFGELIDTVNGFMA